MYRPQDLHTITTIKNKQSIQNRNTIKLLPIPTNINISYNKILNNRIPLHKNNRSKNNKQVQKKSNYKTNNPNLFKIFTKYTPKGKLQTTNQTNPLDIQSQSQSTNNSQLIFEPHINTVHPRPRRIKLTAQKDSESRKMKI